MIEKLENDSTEDSAQGIRINRYVASSGYCSRRKADELVETGKVTVDGDIAVMGTRVVAGQIVRVDGKPVFPEDDLVYIALNKPLGVTCTTDERDKDNIIDFLGFDRRIFPIGRLDKMSTGLILLTNDGGIVNRLLRAEGQHEKEYKVEVDKPVTDEFVTKMQEGVPVLGQITLPCKVYPVGTQSFRIILTQGLNRQIRRMCEYLDYRVIRLKRTRILNIDLGNLPLGQWRRLTYKELSDLKAILDRPSGKASTKRFHDTSDSL